MPSTGINNMRQLIARALRQADDLVLVFDYLDAKGVATRRVVSPIRFLGSDRFLALCLSREEPRQFYLARCQNLHLDWAANFVMPVPMPA
jgi:predicted DNA-binding transcriptional regulator YafY